LVKGGAYIKKKIKIFCETSEFHYLLQSLGAKEAGQIYERQWL
jgi:hypothetical protein